MKSNQSTATVVCLPVRLAPLGRATGVGESSEEADSNAPGGASGAAPKIGGEDS